MEQVQTPLPGSLGLFFLSDIQGRLDGTTAFLLEELQKHLSKIILIHSYPLSEKSHSLLKEWNIRPLSFPQAGTRQGFAAAIAQIPADELAQLTQLVLLDDTLIGPLTPLDGCFSHMNSKSLGFWGLTTCNGQPETQHWNGSTLPYIPPHLPSHFLVLSRALLQDPHFLSYWQISEPENTMAYPASGFGLSFTAYFSQLGHQWESFVNTADIPPQACAFPLLDMPLELVQNRGCPFVMQQTFCRELGQTLETSMGEASYELFQWLTQHPLLDTNLILEKLLRNFHAADLKDNLKWNYVLPDTPGQTLLPPSTAKIALFLHIYYEDQVDYCYAYAQSMPARADVYVTTSTEATRKKIEAVFSGLACNQLTITLIPNMGQDVSALLVAGKPHYHKYDYICYAHDKKGSNISAPSIGVSFAYLCFESILKNKTYVENILRTFDENPRLGLLTSPNPIHGTYFVTLGYEWTMNFPQCQKLANQLGLQVPMDENKSPIAPLGSEFWFRSQALKPLFDHNFQYEDFPPSGSSQETLLNAIERIHPFVVQHQGYYPAWGMPPHLAAMEITNMNLYLKEMHRAFGLQDSGYGAPFDFQLAYMKDYRTAADQNRATIQHLEAQLEQQQAPAAPANQDPGTLTVNQLLGPGVPRKTRFKVGLRALFPQRLYNLFKK